MGLKERVLAKRAKEAAERAKEVQRLSIPTLPANLPPGLVAQLPEPDANGLRFTMKECVITLPNGPHAKMLALPDKQSTPDSGDVLLADALIGLPVVMLNNFGYLHPELRFDKRLQLAGENLHQTWGDPGGEWRCKHAIFSGDTWLQSLIAAEIYCLNTITLLWQALEERLKFLHSEGEEYYIAHNSIAKK